MNTAAENTERRMIQIPGSDALLCMPDRDELRGSENYAEKMSSIHSDMKGTKRKDRPAKAVEEMEFMVQVILLSASQAGDIIAYAKEQVPSLLARAWRLDDYCAEQVGVEGVFTDHALNIYTDGGSEFLVAMSKRLLADREREQRVSAHMDGRD